MHRCHAAPKPDDGTCKDGENGECSEHSHAAGAALIEMRGREVAASTDT